MSSLYTELRKEHLKTWRIWYVMNQRCDPVWRKRYLRNDNSYYDICDEWSREESGEEGFINFFDEVGDLEHTSDLHRRDPTQPYGPTNYIKGDVFTRAKISSYCTSEKAQGLQIAVINNIPKWVYYSRLQKGYTIKQASTLEYVPKHNK